MRSLALACILGLSVAASAKPVWRPAPKRADPTELAARLAEAIRHRDTAGVQAMFSGKLTYNGLWFADAACAKRFGNKGTLENGALRVLARCFAKQKVIATTRKTVMANAAIVTLAPGVELEVVFHGERMIYAGGVWQREADRGQPTLTAQAFEALRTAGTTQLDTALAGKLQGTSSAWIKICLDKTGAIASRTVAESKPPGASELFLAAIADWKFKSFGTPACAMTLLSYPAASAPTVEVLPRSPSVLQNHMISISNDIVDIYDSGGPVPRNVPPALIERNRTRGTRQIEPDARTKTAIAKAGKSQVLASLKLCLDVAGRVSSIKPLRPSGFRDYDMKLEREMRRWTFRPYQVRGVATPVCTAITFVYRAKP